MTPEGKVKANVKGLLAEYGIYKFMPVQRGLGAVTLDFLCCHKGLFLAVETKAEGKKLTPRQEIVKEEIEASGGVVFVVTGPSLAAMVDLEEWLRSVG